MRKGSVKHEGITVVSIYAPNIRVPKYIKQIVTYLKGELNQYNKCMTLNTHLHQWIDDPDIQ